MTISEMAKKYNMTPKGLRYYERIDLISHVNRNKNGLRDYKQEHCNCLELIRCTRSASLSVKVLN